MKVLKLNSSMSGHRFAYHANDVVEWDNDREAAEMIDRGIADEVPKDAVTEIRKLRDIRKHVAPKQDPRDQQTYTRQTMLEMAIERKQQSEKATTR